MILYVGLLVVWGIRDGRDAAEQMDNTYIQAGSAVRHCGRLGHSLNQNEQDLK